MEGSRNVEMLPPGETSELNVVIVDDHVALRRGMELLLRRAGHHVVGTADDAEAGEALDPAPPA